MTTHHLELAPRHLLDVPRLLQLDDVSCGPTCLAQVLNFYDPEHPLEVPKEGIRRNPDGGTLAVHLAQYALDHGYHARLHPLGVRVFDPTWWKLTRPALLDKLNARGKTLDDPGEVATLMAWVSFMEADGSVAFGELTAVRMMRILALGRPILCGLSSTWLYREARQGPGEVYDDIGGHGTGHFVVIRGYSDGGKLFYLNDPYPNAPRSGSGRYPLSAERLIAAILLGDFTRDAVLLEIWPGHLSAAEEHEHHEHDVDDPL